MVAALIMGAAIRPRWRRVKTETPSFRDAPLGADPESRNLAHWLDSGFAPKRRAPE
jgi:hypothetical protein